MLVITNTATRRLCPTGTNTFKQFDLVENLLHMTLINQFWITLGSTLSGTAI